MKMWVEWWVIRINSNNHQSLKLKPQIAKTFQMAKDSN